MGEANGNTAIKSTKGAGAHLGYRAFEEGCSSLWNLLILVSRIELGVLSLRGCLVESERRSPGDGEASAMAQG